MVKQFFLTLIFLVPLSAISDDHVKITDLSWLTGSWDGQIGPAVLEDCLLYTSPSPRDQRGSRMPSSA